MGFGLKGSASKVIAVSFLLLWTLCIVLSVADTKDSGYALIRNVKSDVPSQRNILLLRGCSFMAEKTWSSSLLCFI